LYRITSLSNLENSLKDFRESTTAFYFRIIAEDMYVLIVLSMSFT